MPNASPARCWASRKCCPSVWARATASAGSRALPLRPRHRRKHRSGGSQSDLVHRQAPQGGTGFSRRRHDHGAAVARRGEQARRHPARRPGAGPRRHGDRRQGRPHHRHASPRGGFGPSLNAPLAMGYVETRIRRQRHQARSDGARQGAARRRSRPCRSCPTATSGPRNRRSSS